MNTRPWLKHYDEGVPYSLQPYPERALLDVVSDTVRERPGHTALLFKGARLSYAELERLSDAFAFALFAQGVKKGERVSLLLPNCPQAILAQLGAWKAGAIVAPLNPLYTERELEFALASCGAETIVVLTPYYTKVKRIQPRTPLRRVIATSIKEYLPPLRHLLFTLAKEKRGGHRIALEPGDLWLKDLLRRYGGESRPPVAVGPADPALLLFTGGTTGTPNGAVGTHQALLIAAMQLHAWAGSLLVDWEDRLMLVIPLFHVYGNLGVMGLAFVGRYPLVVVPDPRDLNDLIATVGKAHPACLHGVPTLFNALLDHPKVQAGEVDFKSIKLCVSGAAPLLAETKARFERLTGGHLVDAYGLTESMVGAAITPLRGTYKPGAVGIPLPDVEIRIADIDTAEPTLAPGEVGEILMRAPQLMQGYWERPDETIRVIRDGWLYTGDIGYMDEDGYLYIVDRKKDLIKPSGFQVWPREVEEVIASHPAVAETAVAGVKDEHQGEAVKAWVIVRPGQEITASEIRAYCRQKLAAYKIPKYIQFCESLPKTLVGKVLRRELSKPKSC